MSNRLLLLLLLCILFAGCNNSQQNWRELGANSARGEGISGNVDVASFRIVTTSNETIYVSWNDNNAEHFAAWDGSAWKSIDLPVWPDIFLRQPARLAATENGQLIVAWPGYDNAAYKGIFVGLWDGSVWQRLGHVAINAHDELDEIVNLLLLPAQEDKLHLVWIIQSNGQRRINSSQWNGESWERGEPILELSVTEDDVFNKPLITISPDGIIYLAWLRRNDLADNIYIMKWDGNQWTELGPGSASNGGISDSFDALSILSDLIVTPDGTLYVAWLEAIVINEPDYYDIREAFFKVKQWDGTTWTEIENRLLNSDGIWPSLPSLAIMQNEMYLTWASGQGTARQVYVQRWDGADWHHLGYDASRGESVSQTNSFSGSPKIAASEQRVCVAWLDEGGSVTRIRPGLSWDRGPYLSLVERERKNSIYLRCYTTE